MNIRDLKYLLAIADLGSFSRAAEKCHVSQPTLSGQIKKLEESLGVQLFERTNKQILLTAVGEQIIVSAMKVIAEVDRIDALAEAAIDPLSGRFRLGAFPTLATYFFPGIVKPIKAAMPKLKLILVEEKTEHLIDKLKSGKIDAALLALPVVDERFNVEILFDDYFRLAVKSDHPLASKAEIGQSSLLSKDLLLLEEGHCLRDQALEVCSLMGANEEQDFRATSLETLRLMVKVGTGITLMPEIAMAVDINTGADDIRYIPFKEPRPKRTIGLVWRKTLVKNTVIEELIKILTAAKEGV